MKILWMKTPAAQLLELRLLSELRGFSRLAGGSVDDGKVSPGPKKEEENQNKDNHKWRCDSSYAPISVMASTVTHTPMAKIMKEKTAGGARGGDGDSSGSEQLSARAFATAFIRSTAGMAIMAIPVTSANSGGTSSSLATSRRPFGRCYARPVRHYLAAEGERSHSYTSHSVWPGGK